jgi:hypothetical protein
VPLTPGRRWIHPVRRPRDLPLPRGEICEPGNTAHSERSQGEGVVRASCVCRVLELLPGGVESGNGVDVQTVSVPVDWRCTQQAKLVPLRRQGLPVDEAALAQAVAELSKKLEVYEVILGKQKFLGGDVSRLMDRA